MSPLCFDTAFLPLDASRTFSGAGTCAEVDRRTPFQSNHLHQTVTNDFGATRTASGTPGARLLAVCLLVKKSWVQLGSKCCQIRSKTVDHDAEQSRTDLQDRFFATALGAGGLEFKSPRPDHFVVFPSCWISFCCFHSQLAHGRIFGFWAPTRGLQGSFAATEANGGLPGWRRLRGGGRKAGEKGEIW